MRHILAVSVVLSSLLVPAAAVASQPASDASTPARTLSTGVKPAKVIYSPNITLTPSEEEALPVNAHVVLKLNVDQTGQPQDVEVVDSLDQTLDARVQAAVRQFRFRPAMLDNQPVATDITLTVQVQR